MNVSLLLNVNNRQGKRGERGWLLGQTKILPMMILGHSSLEAEQYISLLVNYDQGPAQPGSIQGTLVFYCNWTFALFDKESYCLAFCTDPPSTQEKLEGTGGLYIGYCCSKMSWFGGGTGGSQSPASRTPFSCPRTFLSFCLPTPALYCVSPVIM